MSDQYQLEKTKKELSKALRNLGYVRELLKNQRIKCHELQEERDYLFKFIPRNCRTCAHWIDGDETPKDCAVGGCNVDDMWEYGGVIKNENKRHS